MKTRKVLRKKLRKNCRKFLWKRLEVLRTIMDYKYFLVGLQSVTTLTAFLCPDRWKSKKVLWADFVRRKENCVNRNVKFLEHNDSILWYLIWVSDEWEVLRLIKDHKSGHLVHMSLKTKSCLMLGSIINYWSIALIRTISLRPSLRRRSTIWFNYNCTAFRKREWFHWESYFSRLPT